MGRVQSLTLLFTCACLAACEDTAGVPSSYSITLDELIGPISFVELESQRVEFELDQEFSEIESVWIEIEAHVYAKQFDACGTPLDPQPCTRVVHLLGLIAIFDKEDNPSPFTVVSEPLEFGDLSDLEGQGRVRSLVRDDLSADPPVGWDYLLDGSGAFTLFWNPIATFPDLITMNGVPPSGEIIDARLIIEGTPAGSP